MANLREISKRMSSIRSIMQITRTMSMISTARIRKALERSKEAEPYKDALTRMLANVASAGFDEAMPLLQTHLEEHAVLFILIASDRGLAGGFNILQQRLAEHEMQSLAEKGVKSYIITCGRKPTEYFTYRKIKPVLSFVGISSDPNQDEAERIASYVSDAYTSGRVDRVELLYWHARNRVDQDAVHEQLLPISKEQLMMPNRPRTPEALSNVNKMQYTEFEFKLSHAGLYQDSYFSRTARFGCSRAWCAPSRYAVCYGQRERGFAYAWQDLQPRPPRFYHHRAQ